MINIQLHNDCPATDTIVPNQFIDRFMPSANGEFVKVYLYLLRCIHSHASNCTISEIADKFNNTEMDIQRALRYWQKEGLLTAERAEELKNMIEEQFPDRNNIGETNPVLFLLKVKK